jgi:low temperature requirement protein LtrA
MPPVETSRQMAGHHRPRHSLLRNREDHDSGRVTMIELFFDLVFVFAVTQLASALLGHYDLIHVAQLTLLLTGIWWIWIYTSWVTNWLDPERIAVRLCLLALMLAGVVLSASLPEAFGKAGPVFGAAFAAIQVGRTLFFFLAIPRARQSLRNNALRILIWLAVAGFLWIAGGFCAPRERFAVWAVALAIEVISPMAYFWVPGLGRSKASDWDIDGAHMAERCALFVIIALGESLLDTGMRLSRPGITPQLVLELLSAFGSTAAMWWIYFNRSASLGQRHIANSNEPGRQARGLYTYLHLPIVAGIIISAVSDSLVMEDTHEGTIVSTIILGGPAIYLFSVMLFKWASSARAMPPLSYLCGFGLFAALAAASSGYAAMSPFAVHASATSILILVCVSDSFIRTGEKRG